MKGPAYCATCHYQLPGHHHACVKAHHPGAAQGALIAGLVTSARVVIRGGHADVHVWVKGAKAGGFLTLPAGQWGPLVELLRVGPDKVEVVHDGGGDVLPGQMLLGDTVAGGPPFSGDCQGDADAVAAAVAAASDALVPDDGFDSAVDALRGDGLTEGGR